MRRLLAAALGVCLTVTALSADTLRVPDDFQTIQAAIANAQDGDQIFVAAGRYVANLDFLGKRILLRGTPNDPSATIIDGDGADCVVKFIRNERETSIIDGFTITNGNARGNGGGGVYCQGTMPTLRRLIITENRGARGGGVLCWDASPRLEDVVLTDNSSQSYGGGAAFTEASSPVLQRVTLRGNTAAQNGGGLASFSRGRPELHFSHISDNVAAGNGGGLFTSGRFILNGVTIADNLSEGIGGGIYANGDIVVARCEIIGNVGSEHAGGLFLNGVRPGFDHVLVARNRTEGNGGGFHLSGAAAGRCNPVLFRVTAADNSADGEGGNIFCTANSNPELNTSIFWGGRPQQAAFDPQGAENSIAVSFCAVQDGRDGIAANENGQIGWGGGNIDLDPLFADPEGLDYQITWANYPEEDETKSPCIDAGNPNVEQDPDETRADMGAFYFEQLRPDILVRPEEYNFGSLEVGRTDTAYFVVLNIGNMDLRIREVNIIPEDSPFALLEDVDAQDLPPDSVLDVAVVFAPEREGIFQGLLHISSNDPDDGELSVRLRGNGGNGAPLVVRPIPDVEAWEDADSIFVVDLDSVFVDPDGDRLVYQIPRWDPNFEIRVVSGSRVWFRPAPDYWVRDLVAVMRAVDQGFNITADTFMINIHPTDDPPLPFELLAPSDSIELGSWHASFRWQPAVQNRWEIDTVRYEVEFFSEENRFSYRDLTIPRLDTLSMVELSERLDLTLGQGRVEVGWRVFGRDDSTTVECNRAFRFYIPPSLAPTPLSPPAALLLQPNYPNPFNAATNLPFELPAAGWVYLEVFDAQGRHIATLWNGPAAQGRHLAVWQAGAVPAGVYLTILRTEGQTEVRRMQLLK